jgi:cytochrome c-type biogenesis protein CcmH
VAVSNYSLRTDCPLPPFGHLPPLRRGRNTALRTVSFLLSACCLVLVLSFCTNAFAVDPLPFKDRAEEVRFQNLTKQLRCLVCQNQDLADSDADLAKDLRKQVFDMMQSGKTDDEIKQYLVARYNDFVLYDPPLKPGTWLLWFTPFVLVLIGACVVVVIVRRRSALLPTESRTASNSAAPTDSKQTESAQPQSGDDW